MLLIQELLFLLEDRISFTAEQYKDKLLKAQSDDSSAKQNFTAEELVKHLADKIDPTKSKQYVGWIAKMYAAKQFKLEDANRLKEDLTLFDKVKSKLSNKDLNSYKKLELLYDALKPFEDKPDEDLLSNKAKIAAIKSDTEVFIKDDNFQVIIPKTFEASCIYGSGTKWCTASKNEPSHFESYTAKGPLFIILAKLNGKDRKFQLHYEDNAFLNEQDQEISQKDLAALSELPGYTKFLNKLIKKHYAPHMMD